MLKIKLTSIALGLSLVVSCSAFAGNDVQDFAGNDVQDFAGIHPDLDKLEEIRVPSYERNQNNYPVTLINNTSDYVQLVSQFYNEYGDLISGPQIIASANSSKYIYLHQFGTLKGVTVLGNFGASTCPEMSISSGHTYITYTVKENGSCHP
ncbi:hypothetical protein Sps_04888 [Shewanella psychrophila]|uniref:Uncharacterized protein n=1 Tax=Shewanella psychrophila TaxID=225848 RepID=A0A1S6HWT1_9GAMM|nr:hypothetical protein [Shewanella psychrophila]AQS39969.1 hypothetical protein Sps_04888 [Shewanella psychrophila]